MKNIFLLITVLSTTFVFGSELRYLERVQETLKQFSRTCSFLEVGTSEYIFKVPRDKVVAIGVTHQEVSPLISRILKEGRHNITLLAPRKITSQLLEKLGWCEHFDVAFIHDCEASAQNLISLADHVFIETTQEKLKKELEEKGFVPSFRYLQSSLYEIHRPKKCLYAARFTQKKGKGHFRIQSNYAQKFLSKPTKSGKTAWIEGVNMVTFVMLMGVYPTDKSIIDQLAFFKYKPAHNDFVLGNIIIQGDQLIAIDKQDERRHANYTRLINAALDAFKYNKSRFYAPKKWIDDYYSSFLKR